MQVHDGTNGFRAHSPVVTIGSFDGVHKGHVRVIEALRRVAGKLGGESVIVSFEPHPREVLYPMEQRPGLLTVMAEKIELLAAQGIDHLLILPFTRSLAELSYRDFVREVLIDKVGMKGLVVGYDHRFGKNREGTFDRLKELAGEYHFYLEQEDAYEEHQVNVSSTKIRDALQIGDIATVRDYLGYDYTLTGEVVHGDGIGHTIGFPTANIRLADARKLLPAAGVYAARVTTADGTRPGMLNIGTRPTVSQSGQTRIEVNIFDFDRQLYGETIRVSLTARIRGERKFDRLEDLQRQLEKDRIGVIS